MIIIDTYDLTRYTTVCTYLYIYLWFMIWYEMTWKFTLCSRAIWGAWKQQRCLFALQCTYYPQWSCLWNFQIQSALAQAVDEVCVIIFTSEFLIRTREKPGMCETLSWDKHNIPTQCKILAIPRAGCLLRLLHVPSCCKVAFWPWPWKFHVHSNHMGCKRF